MTVRVPVTPSVMTWALQVTGADPSWLRQRYKIDDWIEGTRRPTLKQLQDFARSAGIGFGYLLLPEPPAWQLPVPDFREGFDGQPKPSADLMAVIGQSQRRQAWYREYVLGQGAAPLSFVGSAADMRPEDAAADIRQAIDFEVPGRRGSWSDTRRALLHGFEEIGGLSVATSIVGNNTSRALDENEFRGFSLVDPVAPLVFVNTHQTVNGQIFTLAHEVAHVWRGTGGVGNEDPRQQGQSEVERWCNAVASEILVPRNDLEQLYPLVADLGVTQLLDRLAQRFRCGTLVVLQALRRTGLRRFPDFDEVYAAEVRRLRDVQDGASSGSGGDHYNNQPFRIGERLSRALIADALEGRTSLDEAMNLMSIRSLSTFEEYARRLGAA